MLPSLVGQSGDSLGSYVGTLREGQAFGEQSFLACTPSKASIRTTDYCELMSLHRYHLQAIFETDPQLELHVKRYLEEQKIKYKNTNTEVRGGG